MPRLSLAEWEKYATRIIVWDSYLEERKIYVRPDENISKPPPAGASCRPLPLPQPQTRTRANFLNLSGILAAENDQGNLTGLAIYHIVPDLAHGNALVTEHLLAFGLLNRSKVARRLTQALEDCGEPATPSPMEDCARESGCKAIYTKTRGNEQKLVDRSDWLDELLTTNGYRPAANAYCKPLPPISLADSAASEWDTDPSR